MALIVLLVLVVLAVLVFVQYKVVHSGFCSFRSYNIYMLLQFYTVRTEVCLMLLFNY